MHTQNRQVADLGRTHTKSRAEHAGVCAVARGIHRNFQSVIREREASIPPSALWRGRSKRFAFVAESNPTLFLFPDGFISFEPTVGPKRSVTVKAKYFFGSHYRSA